MEKITPEQIPQEQNIQKMPDKEEIKFATRILADIMLQKYNRGHLEKELKELEIPRELWNHVIALAETEVKKKREEIQESRAEKKAKIRREEKKLPKNIKDIFPSI